MRNDWEIFINLNDNTFTYDCVNDLLKDWYGCLSDGYYTIYKTEYDDEGDSRTDDCGYIMVEDFGRSFSIIIND